MIELNLITTILIIESLVILILFILIFLLYYRKKSSENQAAAHKLVNILKKTKSNKTTERGKLISDYSDIEPDALNEILKEINTKERDLYKQIIQIFLNKDTDLLIHVNQSIDSLVEPCLKVTRFSNTTNDSKASELKTAKNSMNALQQESDKLKEELSIAINTLEEISTEYTRVFSGTQTELTLENSSKKMLNIFRDTENRLNQSIPK